MFGRLDLFHPSGLRAPARPASPVAPPAKPRPVARALLAQAKHREGERGARPELPPRGRTRRPRSVESCHFRPPGFPSKYAPEQATLGVPHRQKKQYMARDPSGRPVVADADAAFHRARVPVRRHGCRNPAGREAATRSEPRKMARSTAREGPERSTTRWRRSPGLAARRGGGLRSSGAERRAARRRTHKAGTPAQQRLSRAPSGPFRPGLCAPRGASDHGVPRRSAYVVCGGRDLPERRTRPRGRQALLSTRRPVWSREGRARPPSGQQARGHAHAPRADRAVASCEHDTTTLRVGCSLRAGSGATREKEENARADGASSLHHPPPGGTARRRMCGVSWT